MAPVKSKVKVVFADRVETIENAVNDAIAELETAGFVVVERSSATATDSSGVKRDAIVLLGMAPEYLASGNASSGLSLGKPAGSTDISAAGAGVNLNVNVNGGGATNLAIADPAAFSIGGAPAVALDSAARIVAALNQLAGAAGLACAFTYDAASTRYFCTSTLKAAGASVAITAGGAPDLAALLLLGVAAGGDEYLGVSGLDSLIVQLLTCNASDSVRTASLLDNIIAATVAGRAKLATGLIDSPEILDLFVSGQRPAKSLGVPMVNRLMLNGASCAAGEKVSINKDDFEFRNTTPPAGGTAGRTWVYNGDVGGGPVLATCRANLIKAINRTVDAANVTYNAAATESFKAAASGTSVKITSADAPGGTVAPSVTATACTETLAGAADVWDQATCYGGRPQAQQVVLADPVTLSANHIAKGTLEIEFGFAPVGAVVINRMRPQNEAWTITGNSVVLTLAGGASPNNRPADVIDVLAWA